MPLIKIEDVAAYWIDDDLVCPDCFNEKTDEFTSLVDRNEYEKDEYIYVCDRCQKQIQLD